MSSSSIRPHATATSAGGSACSTSLKNISPETIGEEPVMQPQPHKIVSREEWIAARKAHLAHEKEYTRARDRLSEERHAAEANRTQAAQRRQQRKEAEAKSRLSFNVRMICRGAEGLAKT